MAAFRTAPPRHRQLPDPSRDRRAAASPRPHHLDRKDRCTPLTTQTGKVLRAWLAERGGHNSDPLFPTRRGTPLSRGAVGRLVAKHAAAQAACPSLRHKKVTPHTLRHRTAMALLHAGVDISVIALWLGHESTETTQTYLHADMTIKERTLARTTPPGTTARRYRPPRHPPGLPRQPLTRITAPGYAALPNAIPAQHDRPDTCSA